MPRIHILAVGLPLILASCTNSNNPVRLITAPSVKGSGQLTTKSFDLSGFDSVDVATAFHVELAQSDEFAVSVTADDNVLPHVQVEKNDAVLKIRLNANVNQATLKAKITLPTLKRLDASLATHVDLKGVRSREEVRIVVRAASHVQGEVEAGSLALEASGGSHATLKGKARVATLKGSSASHFKLSEFVAESAEVALSSASSAEVNVKKKLEYDLRMASHLTYRGKPQLGQHSVSGASSAKSR